MSFTADVSFLQSGKIFEAIVEKCINVLYSGRLISTYLFQLTLCLANLYQCPLQRTSHFYVFEQSWQRSAYSVSMSFTADVSFLPYMNENIIRTRCSLYQCPLQRTSHFYRDYIEYARRQVEEYQCPLQRTSHFYAAYSTTTTKSSTCINVLYSGRLISTITSLTHMN